VKQEAAAALAVARAALLEGQADTQAGSGQGAALGLQRTLAAAAVMLAAQRVAARDARPAYGAAVEGGVGSPECLAASKREAAEKEGGSEEGEDGVRYYYRRHATPAPGPGLGAREAAAAQDLWSDEEEGTGWGGGSGLEAGRGEAVCVDEGEWEGAGAWHFGGSAAALAQDDEWEPGCAYEDEDEGGGRGGEVRGRGGAVLTGRPGGDQRG
jgi:hypothetical protein